MASSDELEALMAGYQQADEAATAALIRLVTPPLYRFFASQYGSRLDVEDLLQDTWLRIHKARHTYRRGEPVLPWLYAIARHVKVDSYRRRRRIQGLEQAADSLPEIAAPPFETGDSMAGFERLIASLPASQREVLVMLKVTGMSLEEVARATRCTVGSVKLKAHRAYTRLRSLLADDSNPS